MSRLRGLIALLLCLLSTSALAGSMSFTFKSNAEYAVMLEFASQDRDHQWPGNGNAYKIEDYDAHAYKISCVNGENICYGAWVENTSDEYWGVGMDNGQRCTDCCWVCKGDKKIKLINLNE